MTAPTRIAPDVSCPPPIHTAPDSGWVLWSDATDATDRLIALARSGELTSPVVGQALDDLAIIDTALQALGQELTVALAVRTMCENVGQLTAEHLAARVLDQIYTAAADRERVAQRGGH